MIPGMQAEVWGDLPQLLMLRMLERGQEWKRKANRRLAKFLRSEVNSVRVASLGDGDSGDGDTLTDARLVRVCGRLPALTSLKLDLCREAEWA